MLKAPSNDTQRTTQQRNGERPECNHYEEALSPDISTGAGGKGRNQPLAYLRRVAPVLLISHALQNLESNLSAGSLSTTSAAILPVADLQITSRPSSGERAMASSALTNAEEALLQFCVFYIRAQHQLVPSNGDRISRLQELPIENLSSSQPDPQTLEAVIAFIRLDEVSTQLLLAYADTLRARLQETPSSTHQDQQSAQIYLTRGTSLLRNRLRDSTTASSDANIQAVLLLVTYSADFGSSTEVDIHADALRTMVQQRGGLEALSASGTGSALLHRQLVEMDSARRYHLTLACQEDCCRELRFPDGFWSRPEQ